ncbi:hypothetical protein JKP88DRAFT_273561 [Tribonema minus]|uniref:Uncharacterized protein n=1 Tax=Tribonema minus TaxID=303371 RepID=A0A835YQI6_9STRA|nr:hypothetical protein JKP88DRAFT_273561 [Tribonema minus]
MQQASADGQHRISSSGGDCSISKCSNSSGERYFTSSSSGDSGDGSIPKQGVVSPHKEDELSQEQHNELQHFRRTLRDAAARGDHEAALKVVHRMRAAGLATTRDWSDHVRALVVVGSLHAAVFALAGLVRHGHRPDVKLFHLVLRALSHGRDVAMSAALHVVELMRRCGARPDARAYGYALRVCRGGGREAARGAAALLRGMEADGVPPDAHTLSAALEACFSASDWRRALALFEQAEADHPSLITVHTWNRLLGMARRGVPRDAVTYSRLLEAHALRGDEGGVAALVADMRAAGMELAARHCYQTIRGYAEGGHARLAEAALEAAVESGGAEAFMFMPVLAECRRARDAPRARRWLRRALSLGLAAHAAGDDGAADALWRDAQAAGADAGAPCRYKAMRRSGGGDGGSGGAAERHLLLVDVDAPAPLRGARDSALDVSRCGRGMTRAALRAEAAALRAAPPPALRYVFTGAATQQQRETAEADVAILRSAGAHVSVVGRGGALWKAVVPARRAPPRAAPRRAPRRRPQPRNRTLGEDAAPEKRACDGETAASREPPRLAPAELQSDSGRRN